MSGADAITISQTHNNTNRQLCKSFIDVITLLCFTHVPLMFRMWVNQKPRYGSSRAGFRFFTAGLPVVQQPAG